jgi:hypothetical protein
VIRAPAARYRSVGQNVGRIRGSLGLEIERLARRPWSAGEPHTEVVKDLGRRPLKRGCDAVRDLSEQDDACHGNVIGRDAAEPGQQLVGTDKVSAVQPPREGDEKAELPHARLG